MYSLKITKYKHANNNNYFDNTYKLSGNVDNVINMLQLNNKADDYDILYYTWKKDQYNNVQIKIYSDVEHLNLIAQSLSIYMSTGDEGNHSSIIIESNGSGLTGYIIFYLAGVLSHVDFEGTIETNEGYIDHFEVTNMPEDFITSLSEELFNSRNLYTASDWNIKFTNLTKQRSYLNKNIFDFFENEDSYIYRVVFSINSQDERVGFIDYSSIEKNITEELISFTVFSAERELSIFAKCITLRSAGLIPDTWEGRTFNEIILKICNAMNCNLLYSVDVDNLCLTRNGYIPRCIIDFFTPLLDKSLWEIFLGIIKGIGILPKIKIQQNLTIDNYNKLTLELFLRGQGITKDVIILEPELEGNKGLGTKYWGIKTATKENINDTNAECYDILFSDGNTIKHLPNVQLNNLSYKPLQIFENNILDEEVKWIDIPLYDIDVNEPISNTFKFKSITPLRMFTKLSWAWGYYDYPESINLLAENEYKYLLTNLKKTKKFKIIYDKFFDVSLYNKINYENKEWYIEKISNIDIINEEAEIEITEI